MTRQTLFIGGFKDGTTARVPVDIPVLITPAGERYRLECISVTDGRAARVFVADGLDVLAALQQVLRVYRVPKPPIMWSRL